MPGDGSDVGVAVQGGERMGGRSHKVSREAEVGRVEALQEEVTIVRRVRFQDWRTSFGRER